MRRAHAHANAHVHIVHVSCSCSIHVCTNLQRRSLQWLTLTHTHTLSHTQHVLHTTRDSIPAVANVKQKVSGSSSLLWIVVCGLLFPLHKNTWPAVRLQMFSTRKLIPSALFNHSRRRRRTSSRCERCDLSRSFFFRCGTVGILLVPVPGSY